MIKQNWTFFESATPSTGKELKLSAEKAGCEITIQVYGDNVTSILGKFQGKLYDEAEWIDICAYNNETSDLTSIFNSLGMYTLPILGYCAIRIDVETIEGGLATIKGKVY